MPDAKSLLPGRAFRSEHAQLRPEPHSIASHGPAPMDPLQTTRMRNGVLYAAEWPCCHDPLRLSLGSEDPFYIHNPRVRRARLRPPPPGGRARRARRVRAPSPARGEACAQRPFESPFPPPPSPAAHALARVRARGCLVAKRTSVLLSTPHRPNPSTPPLSQPNLVHVSFAPTASAHARARTPHAGKAFSTPASTLPSLFPTYRSTARAPRPRNPPPTRMHTAPYSSP